MKIWGTYIQGRCLELLNRHLRHERGDRTRVETIVDLAKVLGKGMKMNLINQGRRRLRQNGGSFAAMEIVITTLSSGASKV